MDDEFMQASRDLALAAERLAHAPPLEATALAQDVLDCLAVWRSALAGAENRRRRAMLAEHHSRYSGLLAKLRAATRARSS